MGCSTSRIDSLPAVSLCHDRCKFLEEALHQSYALADAHLAYIHSLKCFGSTLHHFLDQNLTHPDDDSQAARSTTTADPAFRKLTSSKSSSSSSPDHGPSSTSNSGSHIDFRSDSDDEELALSKGLNFQDQSHRDFFHRDPISTSGRAYSCWKTPPPPAPTDSSWDFLNFFEPYERYELPTKSFREENHGSREEFINIFHAGNQADSEKKKDAKGEEKVAEKKTNLKEDKTDGSEIDHNQEKKDSFESNILCVTEIFREVEVLFEKAAESGHEVLKTLDTGKFRFHHKTPAYQESLAFIVEKRGSVCLAGDLGESSVNLSSVLQKLCLWEKKLYDEVKAEEKLRITYAKNCRRIKRLGEKGGNASKVESTQALLGTLSTNIRVAIQVIDRVSFTVNKLRDDELWPQLGKFIEKFLEMWKGMLECHRGQSQAIAGAKNFDAITLKGEFSDAHLEAALQLKYEIQNWNMSFSNWITAQRDYVKALNAWILRCLPQEPEEMPDGLLPFSPGKTGGPPISMFCNLWSHAMGKFTEMEVIEAMVGLLTSVNQVLEQHHLFMQQRVAVDKDMERKIKMLERNEQRMRKVIEAGTKKMFLSATEVTGARIMHQSELTRTSSLQSSLKQIFIVLERFSDKAVRSYEELNSKIEESRLTPENTKGPKRSL